MIPFVGGVGDSGGYKISKSLRFRANGGAYLSKTYAGAPTNLKKGTVSAWIKKPVPAVGEFVISGFDPAATAPNTGLILQADRTYYMRLGGATSATNPTSPWQGDAAAWYHIMFTWDTTIPQQSLYLNGVLIGQDATPTLNQLSQLGTNAAGNKQSIGVADLGGGPVAYFDGYMADIYYIDGQTLSPAAFGFNDTTYGMWQPKKYSGTYGNNGFWLDFSDSSAYGKDRSGNANDWTPLNFGTSGITNDSYTDTPTNFGSDTGKGGEVRGNYCVLNQLSTTQAVSEGGLKAALAASHSVFSSLGMSNGTTNVKWYAEFNIAAITAGNVSVGICGVIADDSVTPLAFTNALRGVGYISSGNKRVSGTDTAYGATYTVGDTIGIALDTSVVPSVTFYKNGVSQGSIPTTASGQAGLVFAAQGEAGSTGVQVVANFGQRPWAFAPPAGFLALCTQNMTGQSIIIPATLADIALYTGVGATQSITGKKFQPNAVWIKSRSQVVAGYFSDTQGGVEWSTADTVSNAGITPITFNSDGFTISGNRTEANNNASTYLAWMLKVRSTILDIRPFSKVNSTNESFAHSLGSFPAMMIVRGLSNTSDTYLWHQSLVFGSSGAFLKLNTTAIEATGPTVFQSSPPDNFSFYMGTFWSAYSSMIAYLFGEVRGFSRFRLYTGNGNANGPFVYCGFKPRIVMIKRIDVAADWYFFDSARNIYNSGVTAYVNPNTTAIESAPSTLVDILSNGFKIRVAGGGDLNAAGGSYVYAAFADVPLRDARAR